MSTESEVAMTDPWKKFLQEELNKEADKIEAEVMKDDSLKDVKTTPEMYEALMDKIRDADAEKGVNTEADRYSALTEEEREFLRIGREIKKQGAKIVYKRKKKRMAFLLVAVMVIMVAGMGVTSVGGPQYLIEVFNQKLGDREMTQVDSNDVTLESGESEEEKAYEELKEAFGLEPVRMYYVPPGARFDRAEIEENIQRATLFYSVNGKVLTYKMKSNYVQGKFSLGMDDSLVQEKHETVSDVDLLIKTYNVKDTGEYIYSVEFVYNNVQYFISGLIEEVEFNEIIKNLHFS